MTLQEALTQTFNEYYLGKKQKEVKDEQSGGGRKCVKLRKKKRKRKTYR